MASATRTAICFLSDTVNSIESNDIGVEALKIYGHPDATRVHDD